MDEEQYYYLQQYLTSPPTTETPKKTFWQTGFGSGLNNIWSWASSNPQQVVALVAPKRVIDPTSSQYQTQNLDNGGFVGGKTPQPEAPKSNNNTLLIVMGVAVVVVLFFLFKKQ